MRKTTLFRQLAQAPDILMLPCAHDALTAKVIQGAGFRAMAAAGYSAAGSRLGLPDIGLMTATELCEHYRGICQAVDIPVLVDMDTGYGDVNNVIRTLRGLEDAGAAAVFIEDQTFPKRCGHMAGKSVISVEEFLPKLKAALWARRDKDLLVMARTDAAAVYGLDEAIRRAQIYESAGADAVFVEAVETVEDMRKVNAAVKTPSMTNMIEGGKTPFLKAQELQELGYRLAAYPCSSLYVAVRALQKWAAHLKQNQTVEGFSNADTMLDFDEYYQFIGAPEIRRREDGFFE